MEDTQSYTEFTDEFLFPPFNYNYEDESGEGGESRLPSEFPVMDINKVIEAIEEEEEEEEKKVEEEELEEEELEEEELEKEVLEEEIHEDLIKLPDEVEEIKGAVPLVERLLEGVDPKLLAILQQEREQEIKPKLYKGLKSYKIFNKDNINKSLAFPLTANRELAKPPKIIHYKEDEFEHVKGSFGLSRNGKIISTVPEKQVFIKSVKSQSFSYWPRELEILSIIEQHENILSLLYYTSGINRSWVFLFFEPIFSTLREKMNEAIIDPLIVKVYSFQLFKALGHIHSYNICHRNIKAENILVNEMAKLKLANFEQSKLLPDGHGNSCCAGKLRYKAPEVLFCAPLYTVLIDIWSAGCLIAELLNSNKPIIYGFHAKAILKAQINITGIPTDQDFQEMGLPPQYYRYKNKTTGLKNICPEWPSSDLQFVEHLLKFNPSKRPVAYSILHHSFYHDLKDPSKVVPGYNVPDCFKFTLRELNVRPDLELICSNFT